MGNSGSTHDKPSLLQEQRECFLLQLVSFQCVVSVTRSSLSNSPITLVVDTGVSLPEAVEGMQVLGGVPLINPRHMH